MKLRNFKKHLKLSFRAVTAAMVFFATLPAVSAIQHPNAFDQFELINAQTKELNLSLLAKIQFTLDNNRLDLTNYVPYNDLASNDNGEKVANQILRKSLQTWFEDNDHADSALIRTASNLNSVVQTSIERNGQSVNFRLKAAEGVAELGYKGYVNAVLSYGVDTSAVKFEVSKNLGNRNLAYVHKDNSDGVSDVVGVRWAW